MSSDKLITDPYQRESQKKKKKKKKLILCIGKTNNTNSDVTTSTKVLCRAARIAETITAGRPSQAISANIVSK